MKQLTMKQLLTEIEALKLRVEVLESARVGGPSQSAPKVEPSSENIDVVVVQFEKAPAPEVRAQLKSAGFRWQPAVKEWHAPISDQARAVAQQVTAST